MNLRDLFPEEAQERVNVARNMLIYPLEPLQNWFQKYLQSWRLYEYPRAKRYSAHAPQPPLSRFLLVPGLLLATVVSTILAFYINDARKPNPNLYYYITQYRPTVSVIVNLIAHTLAFAHAHVLTSMINFSTRILLQQHAPSLDRVKWWKAISTGKLDISLPARFLWSAAGFFVLALLPANLWTGALTPAALYMDLSQNLTIQLPEYAADPDGRYWNQTWTPNGAHSVDNTLLGSFSYTPAYDRRISILNNAANVVADQDLAISIERDDRTGYVYNTRSFGVGASAGLMLVDFGDYFQQVQLYSYNEPGYDVQVDCSTSDKAGWTIQPLDPVHDSIANIPKVYMCMGGTVDSSVDFYLQYGLSPDDNLYNHNIVAMTVYANHTTGNGSVVIATGTGEYSQLNQTQCSVVFIPTLFSVLVNITSRSIDVTALNPLPDTQEIDPTAQANETFQTWTCKDLPDLSNINLTDIYRSNNCRNITTPGQHGLGNIATRALRQLVDLSTIGGNLLQSDLGETFLAANASEQVWCDTDPESNCGACPFYPINHAIRSILDDSLLAFASAQLMIANTTTSTSISASVNIIQFGAPPYIYLVFAFNALLVVAFVHEMLRTRAWRHLPLFNYNDIKSVMIASSRGGTTLADEVSTMHTHAGTVWNADSKDTAAGNVHVQMQFDNDTGAPQLVLAERDGIERGFGKSPWLMSSQGGLSPQGWKTPLLERRAVDDDSYDQ